MSNAQPPQLATSTSFAWLFLSFRGRISRGVYWLSFGFIVCVLFVLVSLLVKTVGEDAASVPMVVLALATMWLEMALLVKRQHDRGLPWFWCLLAWLPVVGILWSIAAGVIPGDKGPNAYGDRPNVPPA